MREAEERPIGSLSARFRRRRRRRARSLLRRWRRAGSVVRVEDWRSPRAPREYGDEGTEGVITRFARWLAVRRILKGAEEEKRREKPTPMCGPWWD
jgi:hypothetical protein